MATVSAWVTRCTGRPLQAECRHDHLHLEPGDGDGEQAHPDGGDERLALPCRVQADDHVA